MGRFDADHYEMDLPLHMDAEAGLDPFTVEALLDGRTPDLRGSAAGHDIAHVLATLRAPATVDELAREQDVLAMYRSELVAVPQPSTIRADATSPSPTSNPRRRRLGIPAKVAVLGAAGVLALTTTAAAFTGSLPRPVQAAAHDTLARVGLTVPDAADGSESPDAPGRQDQDSTTGPAGAADPTVASDPSGAGDGPGGATDQPGRGDTISTIANGSKPAEPGDKGDAVCREASADRCAHGHDRATSSTDATAPSTPPPSAVPATPDNRPGPPPPDERGPGDKPESSTGGSPSAGPPPSTPGATAPGTKKR